MTLRRFIAGGWLVGMGASVLVFGGGCGEDDPAGNTGGISAGGGPKIEDIPATFAKVLCDQQKACLGAGFETIFLRGQDCTASFTKSIEDGDIGASKRLVAEGKLTYDPAKAQACLDAYKALTCAGLTNPAPPACSEIFGGKGTAGSACTIGPECGADHYCKAGSACPGVCTAKAAEGGACSESENCLAGLTCSSGVCAKQVGVGAACDAKRECEPGTLCIAESAVKDAPTSCKRTSDLFTVAIGDACDPTIGKFCGLDAACELQAIGASGATFACAARYGSGKPCKYGFPDGCPNDEYCPTDFGAKPPVLEGVCTKAPAPGAPCGKSGSNANTCAPGDVCEKDVCVTKARLGASCTSSNGCYSGLCKAGVCAEGLACEPPRQ